MASHGIPRVSEADPETDQTRQKQQQKIADYRKLVAQVQEATKTSHAFSVLPLTSKLLNQNPEYYTIWNERRRILGQHFDQCTQDTDAVDSASSHNEIQRLIEEDLRFIWPLLKKFPKCYWIWNHRLWLLQQASQRLPVDVARKFWTDELGIVTVMLGRDSRNFHGWGYRRMVIAELESERLGRDEGKGNTSMVKSEFDYTTSMIKTNLSNFSAWHNRSKLIPRLLDEQGADEMARRKLLDEELQQIEEALYTDPYDQSLWFYHTFLTTTFSGSSRLKQFSIVPSLIKQYKAEYLEKEIVKLKELLDEVDDSKWLYQRLLELCLDYRELTNGWPTSTSATNRDEWLNTLARLDPLRAGRWKDLRLRLEQ